MSAFVVSSAHIDAILDFGLRSSTRLAMGSDELSLLGRKLYATNVKSVCARYSDQKPSDYDWTASYQFRFPRRALSAVEALKACNCFDYQSCETDDYTGSEAANLIENIRNLAISKLPGYADASWEITE